MDCWTLLVDGTMSLSLSSVGPCSRLTRSLISLAYFLLLFLRHCQALSLPASLTGSSASPLQKKKVAVLGTGGYLGALTFGFLQRASSLYGTGIGKVRSIGATAETALRMNRVLSKNFCLAVADASYIKLTDLQSVEAIQQRLEGWDALIIGNDLHLKYRPVTANTFEKTPNDKTYEAFWGEGMDLPVDDSNPVKETILNNVILAAQRAGIQHLVAVDNLATRDRLQPQLSSCSIPYTCILHGSTTDTKDYTYRKGVQGNIAIIAMNDFDTNDELLLPSDSVGAPAPLAREDLAAICVQSLLSLDWTKSRCLRTILYQEGEKEQSASGKRPDQEWCVNSHRLEEALRSIN